LKILEELDDRIIPVKKSPTSQIEKKKKKKEEAKSSPAIVMIMK
jgi:hypothetical protein